MPTDFINRKFTIDLDVEYAKKHNHKLENNHEVKSSEKFPIVTLQNVSTMFHLLRETEKVSNIKQ